MPDRPTPDATAVPRFTVGGAFDPRDLSDAEAERVLAAVDAFPGLSQGAKDIYRVLFTEARSGPAAAAIVAAKIRARGGQT